jgi:UDP-N-acetylmuramate: L-alanyl-gamma-D-glutamyl-meso-diaminopimelate ligase
MAVNKRRLRRRAPRPALPRRVHFLGIHGRMVGALALALRQAGVRVSGSDNYDFPPMPAILREAGIPVNRGWSAANLPSRVDAVVTGAVVFRGNPELEAAMNRGLPVWNTTAFLERHFLEKSENFVVAGTKGKTTTTAMLAWILEKAGLAPDYLIGGQVRGALRRLHLAGRGPVVLEGDEYHCGRGDPLPKFLRYHPRHVVITNVAHEHHELFPTPAAYAAAFRHLLSLVPGTGSIVINADDPGAMEFANTAHAPLRTVGFSARASDRITKFRQNGHGTSFCLGGRAFRLLLSGRMNVRNAALAAVAALDAGVSLKRAAAALRAFPGVEGRQEIVAQSRDTIVYADEANHPIAVRALIEAIRLRHPRRRVVFVLEPRNTGGGDGLCQRELPGSLAAADLVVVAPPVEICVHQKPFDSRRLCRGLRKRGVSAHAVAKLEDLAARASQLCRPGDVIIVSLAMGRDAITQRIAQAACGGAS